MTGRDESEDRRERLAALRRRVEERRTRENFDRVSADVKARIACVGSLEFVGFLQESEARVSSWDLFEKMNRWATQPSSTIGIGAGGDELAVWLQDCLATLGPRRKYHLALGPYIGFLWAKVRVAEPDHWLFALWNQLSDRRLILLTEDQLFFLGVMEDQEHYYCSYCDTVDHFLVRSDST